MHLFDLPGELLDLCCAQIEHLPPDVHELDSDYVIATTTQVAHTTLKAVRLTSKRLLPIANKYLFSRVHLLPTRASAKKTRAILDDQHLNPLVHTIFIRSSLDDVDEHRSDPYPSWDCKDENDPEWETDEDHEEHAIDTDGEISCTFKRTLDAIGLFCNLRRIELMHDHRVAGTWADRPYESGVPLGAEVRVSVAYRYTFFNKVLQALNHAEHPASKVHSLSITNLQDHVYRDLDLSEDFKAVLSRLDSLELCIVSEEHTPSPECEIEYRERHDFFNYDLKRYWLQPLEKIGRLEHLKLYASIYWGYIPKCDLCGLHFPKLKSLSLGHMTFTHDWQLDWISSHGATLRSLMLDDCPIIPDTEAEQHDDFEKHFEEYRVRGIQRPRPRTFHRAYSARWHDYFRKMRSSLPHLLRFAIGEGPWDRCVDADHSSEAFAAADRLPVELRTNRYRIFTGYDVPRDQKRKSSADMIQYESLPLVKPTTLSTHHLGDFGSHSAASNSYCKFFTPVSKALIRLFSLEVGAANFFTYEFDANTRPSRAELIKQYNRRNRFGGITVPPYPDCWDEDQKALDELMAAINSR